MAHTPRQAWHLRDSIFFLIAVLASSSDLGAADRAGPDERLPKLIADLGSPRYAVREKAARILDEMGTAALPSLTSAAKSPDAEVSRRASRLIETISRREEARRLLAGTTIDLSYRDVPVAEIVADIAKKSGHAIVLDASGKGAERKITLESGQTTFWRAIDLLCERASLIERGYADAASGKKILTANSYNGVKKPFKLVLRETVSKAPPASYFMGARVRALRVTSPLQDLTKGIDEKAIVLEISLDPMRPLREIIALRIESALDSRGVDARATVKLLSTKSSETVSYRRLEIENTSSYVARLQRGMDEGNFRRALVLVRSAAALKSLKGVFTVEAQKPSGPVFTAAPILNVAGKSYSTPDGGTLTINQVALRPNGQVVLSVDTSFPLGGGLGGIRMGNGVVRIRRAMNGTWETVGLKMDNLKLLDKDGVAYRAAIVSNNGMRFGPAGLSQTMSLSFTPMKGKPEPAKLVYYGEPTTFVDVPFELHDVRSDAPALGR